MAVDYTIDDMTHDDLDEVLEIERSSFPSPWSRELFLREFENSFSFNLVARSCEEGKGRIVGYIVFWITADEMHILDLAVHKDFRRQGIGSSLVNRALNIGRHRGGRRVFLEVRRSNCKAQRLYRTLGFVTIGERKRYYSDGEDALVMERELQDGGLER